MELYVPQALEDFAAVASSHRDINAGEIPKERISLCIGLTRNLRDWYCCGHSHNRTISFSNGPNGFCSQKQCE